MKSYDVTIQMKLLQQYFHMHMVVFIKYEGLTFDSVDEIEWCYHLNDETFRGTCTWYCLFITSGSK